MLLIKGHDIEGDRGQGVGVETREQKRGWTVYKRRQRDCKGGDKGKHNIHNIFAFEEVQN